MSQTEEDLGSDKRARILHAALEVCQRCGIAAARMEEVAALARVSKGTLYRYFESKEDLFLATIIDSYEESMQLFERYRGDCVDPRARLERRLEGLAQVLASVAPRMTLHYQAWGLVATDPARRRRLYGFLRDFHLARGRELADDIRAGQRAGVFRRSTDASACAEGILAMLSGFIYRATFDPLRASPEELQRCFDVLVRETLLPGRVAAGEPGPERG